MALVKKYEKGKDIVKNETNTVPITKPTPPQNVSPADSEEFSKYLAKHMDELHPNERARIAPVASQFVNLYKSGDFDKVYKEDPYARTYSIDAEKITDPTLKAADWTGHSKELKRDFFGLGDYSRGADSHQEAMTYVADAYRRFKDSKATTAPLVPPTNIQGKIIPNQAAYTLENRFGGIEDVANAHMATVKTLKDRQDFMIGEARKISQDYLKNKANPDQFKYSEEEQRKGENLTKSLDEYSKTGK